MFYKSVSDTFEELKIAIGMYFILSVFLTFLYIGITPTNLGSMEEGETMHTHPYLSSYLTIHSFR